MPEHTSSVRSPQWGQITQMIHQEGLKLERLALLAKNASAQGFQAAHMEREGRGKG